MELASPAVLFSAFQNTLKTEKEAFESFKAKRNSEVLSHERAHQSAGGSLAGAIHINYDGNGVATGGHVPIQMPALDAANPEKSKAMAQMVRNAALAPHDPSGQDLRVAAQALAIQGKAQVLMDKKRAAKG